jgi:hypothetical protein
MTTRRNVFIVLFPDIYKGCSCVESGIRDFKGICKCSGIFFLLPRVIEIRRTETV